MDYAQFLESKHQKEHIVSCPVHFMPDCAFDYQDAVIRWALKRGRSSIFAGTGLGKTLMQLVCAQNFVIETNKPVLIATPLAVAHQFVAAGDEFGIPCRKVAQQADIRGAGIYITNIQKLDKFDIDSLGGFLLDESSILKNESGKFRTQLIDATRNIPYRIAATATPSPNDFMELGNHAQFTGIMSYTDMLSTFFTHDGSETQKWRLKGHAEDMFWRWMATWSVMFQSPADLGFDGSMHVLPPLEQYEHIVGVEYEPSTETGLLFPLEAQSLSERLSARRDSIKERCEKAASLVDGDSWVVWCNLNDEGAALREMIPDSYEVRGSDKDEKKEEVLEAFSSGQIKHLITKPSICGFGMNWQHCNKTAFVGLNDSFEQLYQAIRRFYRFGQKNTVHAHFIASEMEGAVLANIKRKEQQAEHMMEQMVKHMAEFSSDEVRGAHRETMNYNATETMELPKWA